MFLGRYHHNIDEKGRLTVPARYRNHLIVGGAVITQGFDRNLIVFPQETFERILQRVNRTSLTDPNARMLKRILFSNAELVSVDKAGRILIPQFLRKLGKLESEAVIVGMGDYFEVWSPELWSGLATQLEENQSDVLRFIDLDLSTGE